MNSSENGLLRQSSNPLALYDTCSSLRPIGTECGLLAAFGDMGCNHGAQPSATCKTVAPVARRWWHPGA
jgi:hypothetical protein